MPTSTESVASRALKKFTAQNTARESSKRLSTYYPPNYARTIQAAPSEREKEEAKLLAGSTFYGSGVSSTQTQNMQPASQTNTTQTSTAKPPIVKNESTAQPIFGQNQNQSTADTVFGGGMTQQQTPTKTIKQPQTQSTAQPIFGGGIGRTTTPKKTAATTKTTTSGHPESIGYQTKYNLTAADYDRFMTAEHINRLPTPEEREYSGNVASAAKNITEAYGITSREIEQANKIIAGARQNLTSYKEDIQIQINTADDMLYQIEKRRNANTGQPLYLYSLVGGDQTSTAYKRFGGEPLLKQTMFYDMDTAKQKTSEVKAYYTNKLAEAEGAMSSLNSYEPTITITIPERPPNESATPSSSIHPYQSDIRGRPDLSQPKYYYENLGEPVYYSGNGRPIEGKRKITLKEFKAISESERKRLLESGYTFTLNTREAEAQSAATTALVGFTLILASGGTLAAAAVAGGGWWLGSKAGTAAYHQTGNRYAELGTTLVVGGGLQGLGTYTLGKIGVATTTASNTVGVTSLRTAHATTRVGASLSPASTTFSSKTATKILLESPTVGVGSKTIITQAGAGTSLAPARIAGYGWQTATYKATGKATYDGLFGTTKTKILKGGGSYSLRGGAQGEYNVLTKGDYVMKKGGLVDWLKVNVLGKTPAKTTVGMRGADQLSVTEIARATQGGVGYTYGIGYPKGAGATIGKALPSIPTTHIITSQGTVVATTSTKAALTQSVGKAKVTMQAFTGHTAYFSKGFLETKTTSLNVLDRFRSIFKTPTATGGGQAAALPAATRGLQMSGGGTASKILDFSDDLLLMKAKTATTAAGKTASAPSGVGLSSFIDIPTSSATNTATMLQMKAVETAAVKTATTQSMNAAISKQLATAAIQTMPTYTAEMTAASMTGVAAYRGVDYATQTAHSPSLATISLQKIDTLPKLGVGSMTNSMRKLNLKIDDRALEQPQIITPRDTSDLLRGGLGLKLPTPTPTTTEIGLGAITSQIIKQDQLPKISTSIFNLPKGGIDVPQIYTSAPPIPPIPNIRIPPIIPIGGGGGGMGEWRRLLSQNKWKRTIKHNLYDIKFNPSDFIQNKMQTSKLMQYGKPKAKKKKTKKRGWEL